MEICTFNSNGWNEHKWRGAGSSGDDDAACFGDRGRLEAVGLAYHVVFGQNGLTAYERKNRDARTLDEQLKSLQHENELLKGHVDRLKDDPDAIEHQAREELHYTRPGEVIYTLPATSGAATTPSKTAPQR